MLTMQTDAVQLAAMLALDTMIQGLHLLHLKADLYATAGCAPRWAISYLKKPHLV